MQRLTTDGAARRASKALAALAAAPQGRPDLLFVDHLQAYAWIADGAADPTPVVLVMHNLESEGYAERALRVSGRGVVAAMRRRMLEREADRLRALETMALRRATAVACLSDEDAQHLRSRVADCDSAATVVVLPGYPYAPPLARARIAREGEKRRIGMIGTWTWGPNRDTLRWTLERVLPCLPDGCTLVLAGGGLDRMPLPPCVEVIEGVDDVSRFYAAVDVVAVPSLHGSGVQEKAIEAIGSGCSLVATTHAVRGLAPDLPGHVHVADDPEQFARLCTQVPAMPSPNQGGELGRWVERRRAAYRAALACCVGAAAVRRTDGLVVPRAPRRVARAV